MTWAFSKDMRSSASFRFWRINVHWVTSGRGLHSCKSAEVTPVQISGALGSGVKDGVGALPRSSKASASHRMEWVVASALSGKESSVSSRLLSDCKVSTFTQLVAYMLGPAHINRHERVSSRHLFAVQSCNFLRRLSIVRACCAKSLLCCLSTSSQSSLYRGCFSSRMLGKLSTSASPEPLPLFSDLRPRARAFLICHDTGCEDVDGAEAVMDAT